MTIERSLRIVEVQALELQPPLVLADSVSVADSIRAMRDNRLGYALITDKDRQLIGIFTERDVFLSVIDDDQTLHHAVASHMTPAPTSVRGTDPVWRVLNLMHEGGYRQIPVVDEEHRVSGCVRAKDIAEYLVNHFSDRVLNLPPDPEQVAKTPEGG